MMGPQHGGREQDSDVKTPEWYIGVGMYMIKNESIMDKAMRTCIRSFVGLDEVQRSQELGGSP